MEIKEIQSKLNQNKKKVKRLKNFWGKIQYMGHPIKKRSYLFILIFCIYIYIQSVYYTKIK